MKFGIAGRAIKTRESVLVDDVTVDPDRVDIGALPTGSALAVPAWNLATPSRCLAVIVARQSTAGAFTWRDSDALKRIAAALEEHWERFELADFQNRLAVLMENDLMKSRSFATLVTRLPGALAQLLDTPAIGFLPFGLGTTTIDISNASIAGSFGALPKSSALRLDPVIDQVISEWQYSGVSDEGMLRSAKGLTELAHLWKLQIGKCMIGVAPVGSADFPLGLLVVGFASPPSSNAAAIRLRSTALTVAPLLTSIAYRERLYLGFLRPQVQLHAIINTYFKKVTVADAVREAWPEIPQTVEEILQRVDRGIELLYNSLNIEESDLFAGDEILKTEVSKFVAHIKQYWAIKVIVAVDALVEAEHRHLKLILHRLACELILNASKKGVSRVHLQIKRTGDAVVLRADDDGPGFDVAESIASDKAVGIMRLMKTARAHCVLREESTEDHWRGTAKGEGCHFVATFEATHLW